jgi:transposase
VIAVVVVAASAHENAVGITLLDKIASDTDTVENALVDQGFKNAVVAHGEKVSIEVEVVERNPAQTGFVPIPKRWIVEHAYGILMLHRRLVRDYEHQPRTSESRVYWAMTAVILRRLTGATAPAWRST